MDSEYSLLARICGESRSDFELNTYAISTQLEGARPRGVKQKANPKASPTRFTAQQDWGLLRGWWAAAHQRGKGRGRHTRSRSTS